MTNATQVPARMNRELESICTRFVGDIDERKQQLATSTPEIVESAMTRCKARHYAFIDAKLSNNGSVTNYIDNLDMGDMQEIDAAAREHVACYSDYLKKRFAQYTEEVTACVGRYKEGKTSDALDLLVERARPKEVASVSPNITGFHRLPRFIDVYKEQINKYIADSGLSVATVLMITFFTIATLPYALLMLLIAVVYNAYTLLCPIDAFKKDAKRGLSSTLDKNKEALCKTVNDNMTRFYDSYREASVDLPKRIEKQFFIL